MTLNTNPDPRLAPCMPAHSCAEPTPSAHVIAPLYPDLAFGNQQLIYGLINFHQHRNRFMHHTALTPVPKPHSKSIDPRQITASA